MSSNGAVLTVPTVRSLLAASFQALEARKQEINDLNVYPVPDGDTGTNLALTMRSIVDAVARVRDDLSRHDLCATISQAALMGARGNSGVILSQIVRGAMEVLSGAEVITAETLAQAFRGATETAYRAVRRPVEGTILTVLREMAEAAEAGPAARDRAALMDSVIAAGWRSVEKTPTLLKVLADAGVVDAGGYGLVVLLEGATDGHGQLETPIATHVAPDRPVESMAASEDLLEEEESEYTYCVSFLISGERLDRTAVEEKAGRLGDSLLVVGDEERLKIHVHTDDPGMVLNLGLSCGVLSEIEIDNMKLQTAARADRLAQGPADFAPSHGDPVPPILTEVVAVVAGEGNKALFRSLGVDLIVDGGQSMNPSAEDLLRAVEKAAAPSVIILPNNKNVVMTAEQTIGLSDREVHVVPTHSIPGGLSAAVSYDRRETGDVNAKEMRDTLKGVITGEVTQAVRKSTVDGVKIKADDFIGLVEDRVIIASRDVGRVVETVIDRLLDEDRVMLTVLLGEGADATDLTRPIEKARERHAGVEIDVHEGGQPYYPVLLAAE